MPQRLRRENGKEWHAISQSFPGFRVFKKVYKLVCKGFTKPCKQMHTTSSQVDPALQCLKTHLQTICKFATFHEVYTSFFRAKAGMMLISNLFMSVCLSPSSAGGLLKSKIT
jgi:hypothetical protein